MTALCQSIESAFHTVDFADVDRRAVAEQHDQDCQPDRRLRRGHGQDEEHEHLAGDIAEETRERDEIHVHREQHQFDRHQQHDDVLAVDEDARDRNAEQDRAEADVVGQGQVHAFDHGVAPPLVTLAILTMRTRSLTRTADCSDAFCRRVPARWRNVSMIAATIATVSTTAAISNGSRNWLKSALPSQAVFDIWAAAAGSGTTGNVYITRTPTSSSISTSMTIATPM